MYAFEQSCECDYDVDWLTTRNNASYCQVKITNQTFGKDSNPHLLKVIMFSYKLVRVIGPTFFKFNEKMKPTTSDALLCNSSLTKQIKINVIYCTFI